MRFRTLPLLGSIFGTLLALILFTSAAVFFKSSELQEKFAASERRYHHIAGTLVGVRADIYAAMFTVQQYLLDPSAKTQTRALNEVAAIKHSSQSHLNRLRAEFSSGDQIDRLGADLAKTWGSLEDALRPVPGTTSAAHRVSEGTAALSEALNATRNLDRINSTNLRQEDAELNRGRRAFGHFLLWLTSLTVLLGAVVSVVTLRRLRRFERLSESERQNTQRAEYELRRLSQELLKAQEEERKNISRELHDEVGQILTGLRIELGNLQRTGPDSPAFESRIQEAKGLAEGALRSVRNMAMLLRPSMLDDQGLAPSLRWQAKEFSRRFDIPVSVDLQGDIEHIPSAHGVCLYRVIQEVLTNCAKHAQAKRIQIAVRSSNGILQATIEDDGVGFKSKAREDAAGIGLLGISERVRELRGTLFIDSEPGRGTRVDVQLPIFEEQKVNE